MKNLFNTVTKVSDVSGKIARVGLSAIMLIAVFGVATATSIFGFYFLSKAVVALFFLSVAAVTVFIAVWSVGFIWRVIRFFSPVVEQINPQNQA